MSNITDLKELSSSVDFWGTTTGFSSDRLCEILSFAVNSVEQLEAAERERDELRDKFDKLASAAGWSKEKCEQVGESPFDTVEGLKNAVIDHHHSLIKAEKELKRRDAAAGEVIYQFDCGEGWQDVDKTDYERYINSRGISTRKLYTAAQPAALPPKYDDELTVRAELIEAYSKTQCEIAQELGCDSDNESILKAICEIKELGAQQQKVVELPEPVKWPEVPFKYFSEEQVFSMLDAAGVKWEVKK